MRKTLLSLITMVMVLSMLFIAGPVMAADQTVTIQVDSINVVNATGSPSLNITTAVAGSAPTSVTDNTTGDLLWTTNEATARTISVSASSLGSFTLTVEAKTVTGTGTKGTAASAVTLSASPQALITAISNTAASCDLEYVLSATEAQGPTSSTNVTVTFTIAAS